MRTEYNQLSPVPSDCQMDLIPDDRVCRGGVYTYHQNAIGFPDFLDRVGRGGHTQCLWPTLCQAPVGAAAAVTNFVCPDCLSK